MSLELRVIVGYLAVGLMHVYLAWSNIRSTDEWDKGPYLTVTARERACIYSISLLLWPLVILVAVLGTLMQGRRR